MEPAPLPKDWWWTQSIANIYTPKTQKEFDDIVKKESSKKLCVVFFYARWNKESEVLMPRWAYLSKMYQSVASFLQVDMDDKWFSDLVIKYNVVSVPTFKFVQQEKPVYEVIGSYYKILEKKIREYVRMDVFDLSCVIIKETKSKKLETLSPAHHTMRKSVDPQSLSMNFANFQPDFIKEPMLTGEMKPPLSRLAMAPNYGGYGRNTGTKVVKPSEIKTIPLGNIVPNRPAQKTPVRIVDSKPPPPSRPQNLMSSMTSGQATSRPPNPSRPQRGVKPKPSGQTRPPGPPGPPSRPSKVRQPSRPKKDRPPRHVRKRTINM